MALTLRQVAREIAALAHAKALYTVHPILHFGSPQQREIVFRTMASEFDRLDVTVQELLERSEIGRRRPRRHGVEAAAPAAGETNPPAGKAPAVVGAREPSK